MSERPKNDDKPPKGGRKHEGWIRERNGIQYAHFKYRGRRYVESARSSRVGDAQIVLDRMKREIPKGLYVNQRDRTRLDRARRDRERAEARALKLSTVEALVKVWLATCVPTRRNARGLKLVTARTRIYVVPFMGAMTAAEVTGDDMRRFRLWLEAYKNEFSRKLSVATVGHVLKVAKTFFTWAAEEGHVSKAPVTRRLVPRPPEQEPKGFSDGEAAILAGIPDPHGFACRIMLGTGVRWGELAQLQASNVRDGALVLTAGKTGKVRRIPLPPALLAEIKRHVGKLLPWDDGEGYQPFILAVRRLSGIKDFCAHRCRHTFAFRWIWNGGSLSALQAILGHATITTTTIYAKTTDALVRREAERLWAAEGKAGAR